MFLKCYDQTADTRYNCMNPVQIGGKLRHIVATTGRFMADNLVSLMPIDIR